MTNEEVIELAKKSTKDNIKFLQAIIKKLNSHDKSSQQRASCIAYCIHCYFENTLKFDIEKIINQNGECHDRRTESLD